jgi:hypothetical protein
MQINRFLLLTLSLANGISCAANEIYSTTSDNSQLYEMKLSMAESSQIIANRMAVCAGVLHSVRLENFPNVTTQDLARLHLEAEQLRNMALQKISWAEVDRFHKLGAMRIANSLSGETVSLSDEITECEQLLARSASGALP